MRWRWLLILVTLCLFGLLLAAGVLSVTIPIGFTVSVTGRLEPARMIRVTAAESGLALAVHPPGHVEEGDVLLRQQASIQQARLEGLRKQQDVLRRRIEHEQERLAAWADAQERQARLAELDARESREQHELETTKAAPLEAGRDENLEAQANVRNKLAESELKILRELARQQAVPSMEVAKGEARAEETRLSVKEAQLVREQHLLVREAKLRQLSTGIERARLQTADVTARIRDLHTQLVLEREALALAAEIDTLERDLQHRVVQAPWTGDWGSTAVAADEYVTQGQLVGVLSDASTLVFVGTVRESQFPWLVTGQAARVRLAAYPFMKYGLLNGRVTSLETRPGSAQSAFRVEIRLDEGGKFTPTVGMRGSADVVVFRGTLFEYLLAEPGQTEARRFRLLPDLEKRFPATPAEAK